MEGEMLAEGESIGSSGDLSPTSLLGHQQFSINRWFRQEPPDVIVVTARTFLGRLILLMATAVFVPRNTGTSVDFISYWGDNGILTRLWYRAIVCDPSAQ